MDKTSGIKYDGKTFFVFGIIIHFNFQGDAQLKSTGVESSLAKYFGMKLRSLNLIMNEHYTSQMCPKCKSILKEKCGFGIEFYEKCGICFLEDASKSFNSEALEFFLRYKMIFSSVSPSVCG